MNDLPKDIVKLVTDIVKALDPHGDGGRKVTAEEWLRIGRDAGLVVVDVVGVVK